MDIFEFLKGDRFAVNAGVELLEVGNGYAKARMEIKPEHLNGGGVCQGGAIFTLADLAFAAASNSHARLTLSINSTINFSKAAAICMPKPARYLIRSGSRIAKYASRTRPGGSSLPSMELVIERRQNCRSNQLLKNILNTEALRHGVLVSK